MTADVEYRRHFRRFERYSKPVVRIYDDWSVLEYVAEAFCLDNRVRLACKAVSKAHYVCLKRIVACKRLVRYPRLYVLIPQRFSVFVECVFERIHISLLFYLSDIIIACTRVL